MTIAGIPTVYHGVKFRSKLEATWARFFDALGWTWEYEPFEYRGWIPDFHLTIVNPSQPAARRARHERLLVEVKPALGLRDLLPHQKRIEDAKPDLPVWLCGATLNLQLPPEACKIAGLFRPSQSPWTRAVLGFDPLVQLYVVEPNFDHGLIPNHTFIDAGWAIAKNDIQWQPRKGFR